MQKCAHLVEFAKCCKMHVLLAQFGFDTAENEPEKNLQKFGQKWPKIDIARGGLSSNAGDGDDPGRAGGRAEGGGPKRGPFASFPTRGSGSRGTT